MAEQSVVERVLETQQKLLTGTDHEHCINCTHCGEIRKATVGLIVHCGYTGNYVGGADAKICGHNNDSVPPKVLAARLPQEPPGEPVYA